MIARFPIVVLVIGVAMIGFLCPASAAPIRVGGYLVNAEATFTPTAPRYSVPLTLTAQTRLVVQGAPQFAVDFGIIPAADLKKWRNGQAPRYFYRITGRTDTRYITLNAGSYYVVARDLSGAASNGFSVKIRRFTGRANDNGVLRTFVQAQKNSLSVAPNSWDGFVFQTPSSGKTWFDGTFSRGTDRRVTWKILTEPEYQKFVSGLEYNTLLSGANPRTLGFHFAYRSARYYFVLFNQGIGYSAFTVARELYR